MVFTEPTDTPYGYNRKHPPLFFAAPNPDTEQELWQASMRDITREYFRMSRKWQVPCQTPLSNGVTVGEFAMYTITQTHTKRVKLPEDEEPR